MRRSKFLASLAALAAAPFVSMEKPPLEAPPVITNPEHFKRMATEVLEPGWHKAIHINTNAIPDGMSPKEVLDMYCKTGTLVWTKGPCSPVEWRPIEVIERYGKV